MSKPTETLLTCPGCGTPNFTPRGLKAHKCDGVNRSLPTDPNAPDEAYIQKELKRVGSPGWKTAVAQATDDQLIRAIEAAKPGSGRHITLKVELEARLEARSKNSAAPGGSSDQKSLEVVAPGTLSEDAQMSKLVIAQYPKAIGATREILIFGAILLNVEKVILSRENKMSRGTLNSAGRPQGTGLKGWLAIHAPKVNYNTAAKFKRLAEAVHESLQLPQKTDFVHLLSAPVEELPAKEQKKREKLDDCIEGKSQRQLLFNFGIDTKGGKKKGGPVNAGQTLDRRTKEEIARDEFEEAARTLCKLAQTAMDKVLALKGPKDEASVWLLDDDSLEKLKLSALDLHALCVEAQSRRKAPARA
jgi:hypothetical protein